MSIISTEPPLVFLGGTCGNAHWREEFVKRLVARGVPAEGLFNPVRPDLTWGPEDQKREDEVKRTAHYNFFYLTDPRQSVRSVFSIYGYIQLMADLYDARRRGNVVVIDTSGMDERSRKAMEKIAKDLKDRFGEAIVLPHLNAIADYIVNALRENPYDTFFLGGTCGNNPWRARLLERLSVREVPRYRMYDPNIGSGAWGSESVSYLEDQARVMCSHGVYYLGDPMEERMGWSAIPLYSNIETLMGLYDASERSVVAVDVKGFKESHATAAIVKMVRDLRTRFPSAPIFESLDEAQNWLVEKLT